MAGLTVHVVPILDRKWRVKAAGVGDEQLFDSKEQALRIGRRLARSVRPSQLVIHHAPGEIELVRLASRAGTGQDHG